ncbi:MAG: NUDIX domain-containing protein [Candidatus Paceibacterota bacterium]|jgi:8-oxo-dGTP pyrophosphatase MutT (NUDIX family)
MEKEEEKTLNIAVVVFITFGDFVLLAKKTKKIGKGLWSGYGGGIEEGETPEDTAVRETSEETKRGITIRKKSLTRVADTYFHNTKEDGSTFDLNVIVFLADKHEGTPNPSDEMSDPTWFNKKNLPLDKMFPADKFWVPQVLAGKKCIVKASYGPHQAYMIGEPEIEYVDSF